ncbi:hypothetical protein [Streptomyces sp. NPDC059850]|uniref:hypothetical protein n=1 Tax=Streptomyces sp. NPDC059850 TaxID=3346970 RepID=UPI00364C4FE8
MQWAEENIATKTSYSTFARKRNDIGNKQLWELANNTPKTIPLTPEERGLVDDAIKKNAKQSAKDKKEFTLEWARRKIEDPSYSFEQFGQDFEVDSDTIQKWTTLKSHSFSPGERDTVSRALEIENASNMNRALETQGVVKKQYAWMQPSAATNASSSSAPLKGTNEGKQSDLSGAKRPAPPLEKPGNPNRRKK